MIEESALDIEWLNQPSLFLKYARQLAQSEKYMDESKENLDLCKAKIDFEIRENPEEFYLGKLTEPLILNTIIQQEEYKNKSNNYIEAKHEVKLLVQIVKALDQRKNALENLVRLHGQSYFSGPSEPRDLIREANKNKIRKDSNDKIKIKRKIKRKEK